MCYAITATCIRVMSHELNPFMIGFLRNAFGLLFVSFLFWSAGPAVFRNARWPVHFVRTGCAIISGLLFFWALARVPLSDAIALNFAGPIFVAVAAVALLGERMGVRRWLATAVGFLGVLVILRPGFQTLSLGLLADLIGANRKILEELLYRVRRRDVGDRVRGSVREIPGVLVPERGEDTGGEEP